MKKMFVLSALSLMTINMYAMEKEEAEPKMSPEDRRAYEEFRGIELAPELKQEILRRIAEASPGQSAALLPTRSGYYFLGLKPGGEIIKAKLVENWPTKIEKKDEKPTEERPS